MSDNKKLLAGIILVAIGLAMFVSSSSGVLPILGVIIGVIGVAFITFVFTAGYF